MAIANLSMVMNCDRYLNSSSNFHSKTIGDRTTEFDRKCYAYNSCKN
ncbi:hypothetical protein [Nostoc sp.]